MSDEEHAARATAKKVRDVDRGVDEFHSRAVTLSNSLAFTEILGFDTNGTWRGGLVRVAANFVDGAIGVDYQYAQVEIRVVGLVGSKQETIHRAALGLEAGAIDVAIDDAHQYRRIAVFAVYIVDGQAGAASGSLGTADVSAIARMNRT